jgi:hypothetical protein
VSTKEDGHLLEKVEPGEPVFVLRARDELAPEIVREWAHVARRAGVDPAKVVGALNVADQMEEWQVGHGKRRPD